MRSGYKTFWPAIADGIADMSKGGIKRSQSFFAVLHNASEMKAQRNGHGHGVGLTPPHLHIFG